jgi:hypothetical protein
MDGKTFVESGTEVFQRAPVQHLDLVETKAVFAEVVGSPVLARVQTLNLAQNDLGDEEAALLAASPHVRQLLLLGLFANRIGQAGLEAITASRNLAALRILEFDYNLVESPVSKYQNDPTTSTSFYVGAGPIQGVLKQKYGEKPWMEPPENLDRFRMCDAGE